MRMRHREVIRVGRCCPRLGLDLEQNERVSGAALGEETASIGKLKAAGLVDAAAPDRCHGLDRGSCQRPPGGDQALQQLLIHPRPKPMLASMDRIASAPWPQTE